MAKKSKTEELCEATDKVIAQWLEMRTTFRSSLDLEEVPADLEHQFLELKSQIARLQRFISQRLPENYRFGSSHMSDLMSQVVSLQAFREMPEQDKKNLYADWHESFIMLQQLRGVIDVMLEGFPVTFEAAKRSSGNIKKDFQSDLKRKKPLMQTQAGTLIKVVVALAALAGAFWYMRLRGVI